MDISAIWKRPPDTIIQLLPPLLAARDVLELWEQSEPLYEDYVLAMERDVDKQLDELGSVGQQIRKDMKPGLIDKLYDFWDSIVERMWPEPANPEDEILAFDLPLLSTKPTDDLGFSYEDIFAETERLRAQIGDIISTDRGSQPKTIHLPDGAFDFIDESDDWSPEEEFSYEISALTAYWPPVPGKPALGLLEDHEDGGMPIEVRLCGHDADAHHTFVQLLKAAGGNLK